MSLLANRVQAAKDKRDISIEFAKEELETGKLPEGYTAIELETRKQANIFKPKDQDNIRNESGQPIATYQKAIDKWVLANGISPDAIPAIASKETISNEQFNYMSIHAKYIAYVNPGPAFIEAQNNARFGDEKLESEAYFAGSERQQAQTAHRRLPKEIKDILGQITKPMDPFELNDIARTDGTYAQKFKQDGNLRFSTGDIMRLIYKDSHRMPELENSTITKDDRAITNNISAIQHDDR